MGSGTVLRRKMEAHPEHDWEKVVLALFKTEEEAYKWEALVVGERHLNDPLCLNLIPGGGGGGLSENDLARREELKRRLEAGEDLGVTQFSMSNDELKQMVNIHVGSRAYTTYQELLNQGWYIGTTIAYKKINLNKLGLSKYKTKEYILNSLNNGVFPEVSSINLSNHDSKIWISITHPCQENVEIAKNLLSNGWELGRKDSYTRTKLSEVAGKFENHEDSLLKNLPCNVSGVNMQSPCKTKYVRLHQRPGEVYSKNCKKLYELGWSFGSSPTTQTKIKLEEALIINS